MTWHQRGLILSIYLEFLRELWKRICLFFFNYGIFGDFFSTRFSAFLVFFFFSLNNFYFPQLWPCPPGHFQQKFTENRQVLPPNVPTSRIKPHPACHEFGGGFEHFFSRDRGSLLLFERANFIHTLKIKSRSGVSSKRKQSLSKSFGPCFQLRQKNMSCFWVLSNSAGRIRELHARLGAIEATGTKRGFFSFKLPSRPELFSIRNDWFSS